MLFYLLGLWNDAQKATLQNYLYNGWSNFLSIKYHLPYLEPIYDKCQYAEFVKSEFSCHFDIAIQDISKSAKPSYYTKVHNDFIKSLILKQKLNVFILIKNWLQTTDILLQRLVCCQLLLQNIYTSVNIISTFICQHLT